MFLNSHSFGFRFRAKDLVYSFDPKNSPSMINNRTPDSVEDLWELS
jgi:hypothetical protein